MKKRTLKNRVEQLGRIAITEGEIMRRNHQQGVMARTNKAKRILWQYEINLFGCRACDLEFGFPKEWENVPFTNAQFQGRA